MLRCRKSAHFAMVPSAPNRGTQVPATLSLQTVSWDREGSLFVTPLLVYTSGSHTSLEEFIQQFMCCTHKGMFPDSQRSWFITRAVHQEGHFPTQGIKQSPCPGVPEHPLCLHIPAPLKACLFTVCKFLFFYL